MKKKNYIAFLFLFIILTSCNGGGDGGRSSEEGLQNGDSLTIEGTVTFLTRNLLVDSSYAAEITCKSVCNRQTQECAALFKLASNPSDKDEKICDTPIDNSGKYKFEIDNKNEVENEALLVKVENYNGNKREGIIVVEDASIVLRDINPETTASAISVKEIVKQGSGVSDSDVSEHKNLLHNELILMCPSVITPSNVLFVIKNTLNILARDRDIPLFLRHRNLIANSSSLDPIRTEIDNFCNLVTEIISAQSGNNLKVKLVDKSGQPYSNMQMYIGENHLRGSIFTTSGSGVFKTTDSDGYFDVSGLSIGGHSLIVGAPSWYSSNFLWVADERYIGYFYYDSNLFYQEIVFPKVLYLENTPNTSAPNFFPINGERFFAQSFDLNEELNFCGVGWGLGIGNQGKPEKFQIRSNNAGVPSQEILYEAKVYGFTGALSKGGEGVYSNFCNSYTDVKLQPGTYWIVGTYLNTPTKIAVFGGTESTSNGLPILSSQDGVNWSDANINVWYNGTKKWNMLFTFIVE